eukprot:gene39652-32262_t
MAGRGRSHGIFMQPLDDPQCVCGYEPDEGTWSKRNAMRAHKRKCGRYLSGVGRGAAPAPLRQKDEALQEKGTALREQGSLLEAETKAKEAAQERSAEVERALERERKAAREVRETARRQLLAIAGALEL